MKPITDLALRSVNGSGLIYAVIVGMWALVLVPMWVRRHDATSETRSMDRFSTAMRILSRRTQPRPDQRYVVLPGRPDRTADRPGLAAAGSAGSARSRRSASSGAFRTGSFDAALPARQRARLAAARRRNCALLLLALLVLATAALVGVAPWWAPVLAGGLSLLYLAHLRHQAVKAGEIDRRRRAALRSAAARRRRAGAVDRLTGGRDRASTGDAVPGSAPAGDEVFDREAQEWDPVPVPLPSYVTAPVARRPSRVIDLTTPGSWTAAPPADGGPAAEAGGTGDDREQAAAAEPSRPSRPPATDVEHDDLDRILERRPAVND